ncbi:MAG: aminotransferase class III-fold pyridoxal phosphate-dependent enzyme [Dysgonamonadaceae bacterium]|jgi:acetylornithine aminotransferase|nr:aminotransferase class III-fold pyridoxal phosphate-dependent enzyme [Dysgonamonadaceae bacterium]
MNYFDVFPRWPIEPVRAQGCKVYDKNNVEYLDFYGGHAVISIGHSHPRYTAKMADQLQKIGFYSNSVQIPLQDEYAEKLGNASGYPDYSLFMVNSGAEANENALKLASYYNGRRRMVAFRGAFHGRTAAAVRLTDTPSYWTNQVMNLETGFLPWNDRKTMYSQLCYREISAVIIEGIQGVGGIHVPDLEFLQYLSQVCQETDTVLILDEIQSGYGRSGKFFAHQYADIRPDIITIAKGMGNGFPVSGLLVSPKFKAVSGQLGTTFGGNHLACTAALAVLEVMEEEQLVENAAHVGAYLMGELKKFPQIREVRGKGLMIGLVFDTPIKPLRDRLLFEQHVFTGATGTNTFRLLPPLSLPLELADEFIHRFKQILIDL